MLGHKSFLFTMIVPQGHIKLTFWVKMFIIKMLGHKSFLFTMIRCMLFILFSSNESIVFLNIFPIVLKCVNMMVNVDVLINYVYFAQ